MYTRYKPYVSPRHEFTGDTTLVTRVPVVSNSDRIVQMLMTGNYLMAGKVGYDFEADDKLPQHIEVRPGRGCDIVTKLDYVSAFQARLREHITGLVAARQDSVNDEPPKDEPPKQEPDKKEPAKKEPAKAG